MREVKQINIKNQTYYFFDDMVDIKKIHLKLLKEDKKSLKDIDFYYIGYISIKKFSDCENNHSVNSLYLIIHFATEHFKEKNGEKYLIIDSTVKYEEVFSGIISETETLNNGKELSDSKGTPTHNHLVLKRTLNHLDKLTK